MRVNRFYVQHTHDKKGRLRLGTELWIQDEKLLFQWLKVLRFRENNKLILFNDLTERIYQIDKIEYPHSVHLQMITELEPKLPARHLYLFWTLLKKDRNDYVVQKATELGVKELVPIITERSEIKVFNIERSNIIAIEATEQCGRFDVPFIREPTSLKQVLNEYNNLKIFICEPSDKKQGAVDFEKAGVLVGPEGGWSDSEKKIFLDNGYEHLNLSIFTLRAETASIVAVSKLLQ
jgi:16S rRNA (uracil1498-N3)-methyltransferase